jgi:hypothetical protein
MNCVYVTLNRCHWNCYHFVPNVFCLIETTEILIVINVVCEVGKSLETPCNVILWYHFWDSTPLGQVIKGLDFWLRVVHHSFDRLFG